MNRLLALLLTAFAANASAGVMCTENPRTNAMHCYEPKEVREKDGIRTAPLYRGGPNGVKKTSFHWAVNCESKVVHIKDANGVSFAGGFASGNATLRIVADGICKEKVAKK